MQGLSSLGPGHSRACVARRVGGQREHHYE